MVAQGPGWEIGLSSQRDWIMPDAFILKQFIVQPNLPNVTFDGATNSETIQLIVTPKGGGDALVAQLRYKRVGGGGFISYQSSRGDIVDVNRTYTEGAAIRIASIKSRDVNTANSDGYSISITGIWLRN